MEYNHFIARKSKHKYQFLKHSFLFPAHETTLIIAYQVTVVSAVFILFLLAIYI